MTGWWMLWILPGIPILAYLIVLSLRRFISPVRKSDKALEKGNIHVPNKRTISWKKRTKLAEEVLENWSSKEIPSWWSRGKVEVPRIFLANLFCGKDIEMVNEMMQVIQPWGKTGSTWWLNSKGDYDFTMVPLITILYLFGDKEGVSDPSTSDHIVKDLLRSRFFDNSNYVPWTLGLAYETENHVLMTESSLYLKARWISKIKIDGAVYNDLEDMEFSVLEILGKLKKYGFYEFNSDPYCPYTVTALLNLEAFGSKEVSKLSRELLDGIFYGYAIGSFNFRRMVPFQRQLKKAGKRSLSDPLDPFMKIYCYLHPKGGKTAEIDSGSEHALMAYVLPYRPPDKVMDLLMKRGSEYYVRMGHGKMMSPEIYSGGPRFLLSAGGVYRGVFSRIVSRPITLILDDGAKDLIDTLHMYGPGPNYQKWNNTGVYDKFAVSAGSVHVPKGWKPVLFNKLWKVYRQCGVTIGIHSRADLGIIVVLDMTPEEAMIALDHLNHDEKRLKNIFGYPGGASIRYDVFAPKDQWVIVSVGDQEINIKFDSWPLLNGYIEKK